MQRSLLLVLNSCHLSAVSYQLKPGTRRPDRSLTVAARTCLSNGERPRSV